MDSDDGGGGGGLEKRETRNGRGWEEVEARASKGERWGGREKIALGESEFGFVPRKAIS